MPFVFDCGAYVGETTARMALRGTRGNLKSEAAGGCGGK